MALGYVCVYCLWQETNHTAGGDAEEQILFKTTLPGAVGSFESCGGYQASAEEKVAVLADEREQKRKLVPPGGCH